MDIIRAIYCGVQSWKAPFTKELESLKSKESLLVIAFITLALLIAPFTSRLIHTQNVSSIDLTPAVNLNEEINTNEQIDIKEIVKKTRSYSYSDTQLGFYLKDLLFFTENSKLDAEHKILESLPRFLSKRAKRYLRAVLKISQHHQIDPIWIISVMWTESNFDYSAKSWAGARGLMQIMPDTRKFIYKVYKSDGNNLLVEQDGFNIDEYFPYKVKKRDYKKHIKKLTNIELGVIYLKNLLSSFKSHKYATVAYNMGPGWTRGRLKRNLPVGMKNEYLDKVRKAYKTIVKEI